MDITLARELTTDVTVCVFGKVTETLDPVGETCNAAANAILPGPTVSVLAAFGGMANVVTLPR